MKVSVIGCGYLGAVHAASMAHLGHEVVGIDVDEAKISALNAGVPPFFEPEFPELLTAGLESGRLSFSTDYADVAGAKIHFIGVGTPQKVGEQGADLTYVHAAVDSLIPHLKAGDVVVGKSTVPVGTAQEIQDKLTIEAPGVTLIWNPEFLREGYAVQDTIAPDRFVYGLPDLPDAQTAKALLDEVYAGPLASGIPLVVTDLPTSELVKVAANSFLATKISFINAVAQVADVAGADITKLAEAIGYDDRIGAKFLRAGVGFGGGCLPKDIRAFRARAEELGVGDAMGFLKEVDDLNVNQRKRVARMVRTALGGDVNGRRVAILGLSFKPITDDIRDSPAVAVAVRLKGLGADVVATDPQAIDNATAAHPQLTYVATPQEAVKDAEVVLLLTEWSEYVNLDPTELGDLVANRIIIDGRNALDPEKWRNAGWHYSGIGRR